MKIFLQSLLDISKESVKMKIIFIFLLTISVVIAEDWQCPGFVQLGSYGDFKEAKS